MANLSALEIIERVKAQRAAAGLLVEWIIPHPKGGKRYYSAYAKDEPQKAAWIANGEHKGWEQIVRIVVLPNQTFRGVLHFEETKYDVSPELARYAIEQGIARNA